MTFDFTLHAADHRARLGTLTTPHGSINTPALALVATQGAVKAMSAPARRRSPRSAACTQ